MRLNVQDTLCGCSCACNCSHIRNLCLDGSLSEVTVVVGTFLTARRIDYQVYRAICYKVIDVWSALLELFDFLSFYSGSRNYGICSACSKDLETSFLEELSDLDNLILVLSVYRDQDSSACRKESLCSLLSLVECLSVVG